jgi:hypothetical protein
MWKNGITWRTILSAGGGILSNGDDRMEACPDVKEDSREVGRNTGDGGRGGRSLEPLDFDCSIRLDKISTHVRSLVRNPSPELNPLGRGFITLYHKKTI